MGKMDRLTLFTEPPETHQGAGLAEAPAYGGLETPVRRQAQKRTDSAVRKRRQRRRLDEARYKHADIRFTKELIEKIDRHVGGGSFRSRSEVVAMLCEVGLPLLQAKVLQGRRT